MDNNSKNRTLIILGMHRSGTSALTGSLEKAGLYLGDVGTTAKDNVKGNRESKRIFKLHEDIFRRNGGSWADPIINPKWDPIHEILQECILESYYNAKLWGFKDPRTLFMLDRWVSHIPHAELIGIFRHPFFVAESLHRRNNMPYESGLALWSKYNDKLLDTYQSSNCMNLIEFSEDSSVFQKDLHALLYKLDLDSAENDFYDSKLRQSTPPSLHNVDGAQNALRLYDSLRTIAGNT